MSFEVPRTPSQTPGHFERKGLMPAGEVIFADNQSTPVRPSVSKDNERAGSMGQAEFCSHLFRGDTLESLNERAAFDALVKESGMSWAELTSRRLPDKEMTQSLRSITREYLTAWRATSSDKLKLQAAVREKFKEIVQRHLH